MKSFRFRPAALLLAGALLATLILPSSAFGKGKGKEPCVADFSKNGLIGQTISFAPEDFQCGSADLRRITIRSLPDSDSGTLVIGGQPLTVDSVVERSALAGLGFQAARNPKVTQTSFTFTPEFSSGKQSKDTTVTLHLLTAANQPPIALDMDLSTYKNIAITGYFDAMDSEGDPLTFQLTSTPARGAVTLAEDGSSQFVYTPYENKTGRDSFSYVAVDPAGNTSPEARITIRIEKAATSVTYADMTGHSAHKAAIRLAQEGIFVGHRVNGQYFFQPDEPVSREEFLTMAMVVAGMAPLEDVSTTGFFDDQAIPAWVKGNVAAALKAGVIRGFRNEQGAPVFGPLDTVTYAEATVMLNNLLSISDVPLEVFASDTESHWAAQAAANLTASGVIQEQTAGNFNCAMTRAEAAELLDGALDLQKIRSSGWFR